MTTILKQRTDPQCIRVGVPTMLLRSVHGYTMQMEVPVSGNIPQERVAAWWVKIRVLWTQLKRVRSRVDPVRKPSQSVIAIDSTTAP